jgi:hypothetical protein
MNLQQNIKKILREEERKNKTQEFQKLIDDEIESMKQICEKMSADDFGLEDIISFDACDFLGLDPKVTVTDVDKFNGKLRILVVIKYEAAMHFHDEESFVYELQWRLKWVGNVMIDVEDVITTYPTKLNESFTGDTPTDFTKQFMNKPVKLIGDVNTNTIIQNVNVNRDGSVNMQFQNGMRVNSSLPMLRKFNFGISIPLEFKIKKKGSLNESEIKTYSSLHRLLNMLFDGFDNIDYDWANYMCGMGECCDPYAIGFTLPESDYDDYLFKLVDGEMYDDDSDYPEEFQDELPEPCFQQPDLKDPKFDTIVFYGYYAEEIEDYMGNESNWSSDLLKIINNQFGCDAKRIVII